MIRSKEGSTDGTKTRCRNTRAKGMKRDPKGTTENPTTGILNLKKVREQVKTRRGEKGNRIEVRNKRRATQIYPTHF